MGLLDWWRGGSGATNKGHSQQIIEAVERVVRTTDPRLRVVQHYRARLAPAVEVSLGYAHEVVAALPAPRDASAAGWSADPYIRAFFATVDDLARAFSSSPELRAHFDQNPADREACALLGMEITEHQVFGAALEGETIRREVLQTTVSFGDYHTRICGRTEPEVRAEIERRIVDELALEGLACTAAEESRRTVLEQKRALLKARLQLLKRHGTGFHSALGGAAVEQPELARLESQIEENARNLTVLGGGAGLLDRELELIRAVLAAPAEHLRAATKPLCLDRMNIVLSEHNAQAGTQFEFPVVSIPGDPPHMRAFTLVRFPRAGLLPAGRLLDEAVRLLM